MINKFLSVLAAVALALGMTVGVAEAAHGPHGGPHDGDGGISGTQPTGDASSRSGRTVTCTNSGVVVLGSSTCQTSFDNGRSLTCTITAGDMCTDTLQGLGGVGRNGGGLGGAFGGLDRRGPGGPRWPYPGLPGGFPQALNGNLLSLSALYPSLNANVNICLYPSFQQFDAFAGPHYGGGWTIARNQWFHQDQATAEWLALQQIAGCGSGVVLPQGLSGFNGMLNGSYLNLSQYGINGYSQLNNMCTYNSWDTFANTVRPHLRGGWNGLQTKFGRDRGMWMNNFNQLQMQMGCSSGGVVVAPISQPVYPAPVVNSAPVVDPAPAASPTAEAAPPVAPSPPTSNGTIIEVPSGPVPTGDSGLAPDAVRAG